MSISNKNKRVGDKQGIPSYLLGHTSEVEDEVVFGGVIYQSTACFVNVDFSTELGAGKWIAISAIGGSTTLIGLTDTNSPSVPLGYLVWNAGGTSVEYSTTIPYSALSGAPSLSAYLPLAGGIMSGAIDMNTQLLNFHNTHNTRIQSIDGRTLQMSNTYSTGMFVSFGIDGITTVKGSVLAANDFMKMSPTLLAIQSYDSATGFDGRLSFTGLSANRVWQLQDNGGTLALLSDIAVSSLTTTGTSGVATLIGGVLNIPNYAGADGNGIYGGSGSLIGDTIITNSTYDIEMTGSGGLFTTNAAQSWGIGGNLSSSYQLYQVTTTHSTGHYIIQQKTDVTATVFGQRILSNSVKSGAGSVYGVSSSVEGTHAAGTNVGGYFNAQNGLNNYALLTLNGNVGLGTLTPSEKLEVVGNSKVTLHSEVGQRMFVGIANTGQNVGFDFQNNATVYMHRWANNAGTILFNMRDNGNASFGTTADLGYTLGVQGNSEFDGHVLVENVTAPVSSVTDTFNMYANDIVAGNAAPHFRTEVGDIVKLYTEAAVTTAQGLADALTSIGLLASSTIAAGAGDGNGIYDGSGSLTAATVVTQASNDLTFSTTGSANTLFIDGGLGRVGIGTASPSLQLEVVGAMRTSSYIISDTDVYAGGTTARMGVYSSQAAFGYSSYATTANAAIRQVSDGRTYISSTSFVGAQMVFNTGGFARLSILNSGEVGIGTGTPSQKLEVAGNTTSSGWVGADTFRISINGTQQLFAHTGDTISTSTYVGYLAGNVTPANATGDNNSALGNTALRNITTGGDNTAIGVGTLDLVTIANDNTAVGKDALTALTAGVNHLNNTAIGYAALSVITAGNYNTSIGHNAGINLTGGSENTFLGSSSGAATAGTFNESIAIGRLTRITASNQLVIGSTSANITDFWMGYGVERTTTNTDITFHTSDAAAGTDVSGGNNYVIAAGAGRGTGVGGHIKLQTAAAGTTGSTLNALTTRLEILDTGEVGIGTSVPTEKLEVVGNALITSGELTITNPQALKLSSLNGRFNIGTTADTNTHIFVRGTRPTLIDLGDATTSKFSVDANGQTIINHTLGSGTAFRVDRSGETFALTLRSDDGNVGIGVGNTPSTKLEVGGGVTMNSTTELSKVLPITAAQASLVTPANGNFCYVTTTDATFTSIGFWKYENAAWAAW